MFTITGPVILVFILWAVQVVIAYKILTTRRHIVLGRRYLTYAQVLFKENDQDNHVQEIDRSLPELAEYRLNNSGRFLYVQLAQFFMLILLVLTLAQVSSFLISLLAAVGFGYSVAAAKEADVDRRTVDSVCNTCEALLHNIGYDNVYNDAMRYPYTDDPPPSS